MGESRYKFLNTLIGLPWVANAKGPDAYDCFHLVQHVEKELFGRSMKDVIVPNELSWWDVIRLIEGSEEFANWQEIVTVDPRVFQPEDGAIVAMASHRHAAHIGVWFSPEHRVLHVDRPAGVCYHDMPTLRVLGWMRLRFYVPKGGV